MKDFEELYQFYQKDIYFFLLKLTGYKISLAEGNRKSIIF